MWLSAMNLARTRQAKGLQPDAPVFQSSREMFEKMEGKIDAVTDIYT